MDGWEGDLLSFYFILFREENKEDAGELKRENSARLGGEATPCDDSNKMRF